MTVEANTSPWSVTTLTELDRPAMQDLFEDVFAHTMTQALWHWKYGDGRGVNIGAWREGRLVGHYGGLSRRILLAGQPALALQGCDVMVQQQDRGVLTRRGPMFQLTSAAMDTYVGFGKTHALLYGFPNARHMRIAERHGLYTEVCRLFELRWDIAGIAEPSSALECLRWIPELSGHVHSADALWRLMAAALPAGILVERDAAYLRYRYCEHPSGQYHVYLTRGPVTEELSGLFVLKLIGADVQLMDFVGSPAVLPEVFPMIGAAARELASGSLYTWISSPYVDRFTVGEPVVTDADIPIPTQIWSPGLEPDAVMDRWWLMPGDTDFQ